MGFVHALFGNVVTIWVSTLGSAAMMWGIERLFPRGVVSLASQLRSLIFWLFAGLSMAFAASLYDLICQSFRPRPLVVVPLNSWLAHPLVHWSMYVVAPVVGMILYDFF